MVSTILFSVVLVIVSSSAYVLIENDDPKETILWPSEFYFSAETIDLKKSYVEPFEVWYSAENNRSRIDYYGGVYKEYYVAESDDEPSGYMYAVYPVTTEETWNEITCSLNRHYGEQPDFLPDPEQFEYVEQTTLDGREVQVWQREMYDDEEEVEGEVTLYVLRTDYDFDIPIKKVTKISSLSKGAVITFTIVNYKHFNYVVNAENITYDDEQDCDYWTSKKMDFKTHLSHLHPRHPKHIDEAFNLYKNHHNKKYHPEEHDIRKAIFHKNWRRIVDHNSKNKSYKMDINEFSDWTPEERQKLTGTFPTDPTVQGSVSFPHTDIELNALSEKLPQNYDLRIEGYLGPVKHQGACGSCWAFTATATVEGMFSKFYGARNLDLSEQSLVDCAWGFGDMGCDGGQLDKTFDYIFEHGIPKENDYGDYIRKNGYCKLTNETETIMIKGYTKVPPLSPTALKVALVKYGPVAVAIHATDDMKNYASGIFYDPSCDDYGYPNHGVVVVGYGRRDGTPYWIVRNSWGEGFGMDGYILMSQTNNNCFVMNSPFYPIV